MSDAPDGTVCDVIECGAVPTITVRFVEEAADPDAIEALDSDQPVTCIITATIDEIPGAAIINVQATQHFSTTVGLLAEGFSVDMLVRGDTSHSYSVGCTATPLPPAPGEPEFILVPSTGLVPLHSAASLDMASACSEAPTGDLEIPVVRNASSLQGLFDISGQTETTAIIEIEYSSFEVAPPLFSAATQPTPTDTWRLNNIEPGQHEVLGKALFDEGWQRLELPHVLNVAVLENDSIHLGRTLVVRPRRAEGSLLLYDTAGLTSLKTLNSDEPFTSLSDQKSRIYAEGAETFATDGMSGAGGVAEGALRGTWDTTNHEARLDYTIHLSGLSDRCTVPSGGGAGALAKYVQRLHMSHSMAVLCFRSMGVRCFLRHGM